MIKDKEKSVFLNAHEIQNGYIKKFKIRKTKNNRIYGASTPDFCK